MVQTDQPDQKNVSQLTFFNYILTGFIYAWRSTTSNRARTENTKKAVDHKNS